MFFQLLSTIKVNLVAKIMQSAYLCVIFHVKHKKLPFLAVLTWFLILGKIQDGDHCWWRHRPPAAPPPIKYTSTRREDQRLSTKGKIVSKYCNISNTPGRGLRVLPRVKDANSRVGITKVVFKTERWNSYPNRYRLIQKCNHTEKLGPNQPIEQNNR